MRFILMTLSILMVSTVKADAVLDVQIDQLIEAIEKSECQFIRNGKSHTPSESVSHIRKKYAHFKDDIDSVHRFIELSASKSLITGRSYQIQCQNSDPVPSSRLLNERAEEIGI